jgi:23S rRNA pseudouridine1911/1915/1917 synthase
MNSFVVDNANRLDKFLAEKLPDLSRGQIQKAIEGSQVLVNGKVVSKPSIKVDIGDEVSFPQLATRNSGLATVPVDLPLKILYDANDLLIIDKPAGLTVHPGPAVKEDTLSQAIVFHYPEIASVGEPSRPGIVHRLDKDTSGCLLVAKTQSMYEYLLSAFADRKVRKEYLALVWGSLPQKHGVIDTPMGKSKLDFRKRTVVDPLEAKEAKTEYFLVASGKLQAASGEAKTKNYKLKTINSVVDEVSLIRVLLHTGRTHQIRVPRGDDQIRQRR